MFLRISDMGLLQNSLKMKTRRQKIVFDSLPGRLAFDCLPYLAGFASRGQTSSFGGLRPREEWRRAYHHQSFNIEHNRLHERLKLNFGQPSIPRAFFYLREDSFKRRSDFAQPSIFIFILSLHVIFHDRSTVTTVYSHLLLRLFQTIRLVAEDHSSVGTDVFEPFVVADIRRGDRHFHNQTRAHVHTFMPLVSVPEFSFALAAESRVLVGVFSSQ